MPTTEADPNEPNFAPPAPSATVFTAALFDAEVG
jgi:hypothetical protein